MLQVYEISKISVLAIFCLIGWSASTLWQNSFKSTCPQKKSCCGFHSQCNISFKIFKWKVKINAVYCDECSIVEVFLFSRSGLFCDAFKIVSEWFECKDLTEALHLGCCSSPRYASGSLFNFYKKKTAGQFDIRGHLIQDSGDPSWAKNKSAKKFGKNISHLHKIQVTIFPTKFT